MYARRTERGALEGGGGGILLLIRHRARLEGLSPPPPPPPPASSPSPSPSVTVVFPTIVAILAPSAKSAILVKQTVIPPGNPE